MMILLDHLLLIVSQHPQLLQSGMDKRSHYPRALHKVSTGCMDLYHMNIIEHHLQGSHCHLSTSLLEDLAEISSLAHL